jgi:hypothetical protein
MVELGHTFQFLPMSMAVTEGKPGYLRNVLGVLQDITKCEAAATQGTGTEKRVQRDYLAQSKEWIQRAEELPRATPS